MAGKPDRESLRIGVVSGYGEDYFICLAVRQSVGQHERHGGIWRSSGRRVVDEMVGVEGVSVRSADVVRTAEDAPDRQQFF